MNLAEIESALLAAIEGAASLNYLKTVEPASSRSFDRGTGQFVVVAPAALTLLLSSQLRSRDISAGTYDYQPRYLIYAIASNLRGAREEKFGDAVTGDIGAYQLLDDLKTELAGLRLTLPSSSTQPVVELAAERLESFTPEYAAYSLEVTVRGSFHA